MRWIGCVAVVVFLAAEGAVCAQQVANGAPMRRAGDSFYESIGSSWGFNWGGLSVNFGGMPAQRPGGATGGFGWQGPHGNGWFNAYASQGSTRGSSSVSPSVTTMNGQPGMICDVTQSPFVIGVIPVVGGGMAPVIGGIPSMPFANPMMAPGATTVQLPTWHMFGVGTSVNVPAGGSTLLGGVNRAEEMNNQFGAPGLPGNRAMGRSVGASSVRATAQIHDMAEMDRQILAGAPQANSAPAAPPIARDASSAARGAMSVAEARRLHEAEQGGANDEIAQLFERAKNAAANGNPGAARVLYQMIAKKTDGPLRAQALERLAAITPSKSKGALAQSNP